MPNTDQNIARKERMAHANDLLREIGSHGRRFFYHAKTDTYARFLLDAGGMGRLYYVDEYTKEPFSPMKGVRWKHFSNGGTLADLVLALSAYITHAYPLERWMFCSWNPEHHEDNRWGYSAEGIAALQNAIRNHPAIRPVWTGAYPLTLEAAQEHWKTVVCPMAHRIRPGGLKGLRNAIAYEMAHYHDANSHYAPKATFFRSAQEMGLPETIFTLNYKNPTFHDRTLLRLDTNGTLEIDSWAGFLIIPILRAYYTWADVTLRLEARAV